MKRLIFICVFILVAGMVILGCSTTEATHTDTTQYLTIEEASEWKWRLITQIYDGFISTVQGPIIIQEVNMIGPNSASGVDCNIHYRNIGEKDIKYITFSVTPFNRVNDSVASTIGNKKTVRLRDTGPHPADKEEISSVWENVWYNPSIDHLVINEVDIIYMDDTMETLSAEYISAATMPETLNSQVDNFFSGWISSQDETIELQTALMKHGYYKGPLNGEYNDLETIKAANAARDYYGLPNPLDYLDRLVLIYLKQDQPTM